MPAPMQIGQPVPAALADATVLDAAGEPHRLGDAWAERDALLLLVRHFACAGCAAHVAALRPRLPELIALGIGVTVIGNGTPLQLAAFAEREALDGHPIDLRTDPDRATYAAAGLRRSRWGTAGPRAVAALIGLVLRGHRNGLPQGDLWQQGGTLYVARGGALGFRHASADLGDNAALVDLVDVALRRRAEASVLP